MRVCILTETAPGETRVAATPESVKKLIGLGHSVIIESNAGRDAGFHNEIYSDAGADIASDAGKATEDADIVLGVRAPAIERLKAGQTAIALFDPFVADFAPYNEKSITTLAMEFTPRISRAQSMDALSSQSNLAGYRAVIEGAQLYGRAMPMMMTAAGTIAPAKVFVMGAGVAGLQAIATARRLGAVVSATDVRPAAKEQVGSLGAKFVAVEDEEFKAAEADGGYAKQMSDAYKAKQSELVAEHIAKQDIVVTTALIPGRPAPELVSADMVKSMKPGSVIVDMAAAQGGNCALTRADEILDEGGVKIAGYTNLPARLPADASALYAKNLLSFLPIITGDDGALNLDTEDEILREMLVTRGGKTINERIRG